MSVSCYFGLTESGKSYHVKNHVLPLWSKKIVVDIAHCFDGGDLLASPTDQDFIKAFDKLKNRKDFFLIIRPGRNQNDELIFNKASILACSIGRMLGSGVQKKDRVQFICDEADFVCTSHYQSKQLKHLVNKGRHDNVDSHFIARNPSRLHTDIRVNCSKIVTFYINGAVNIPLFADNFSRKISEKISHLPKYHRLEWSDNGEINEYDKNGKLVQNLSRSA